MQNSNWTNISRSPHSLVYNGTKALSKNMPEKTVMPCDGRKNKTHILTAMANVPSFPTEEATKSRTATKPNGPGKPWPNMTTVSRTSMNWKWCWVQKSVIMNINPCSLPHTDMTTGRWRLCLWYSPRTEWQKAFRFIPKHSQKMLSSLGLPPVLTRYSVATHSEEVFVLTDRTFSVLPRNTVTFHSIPSADYGVSVTNRSWRMSQP